MKRKRRRHQLRMNEKREGNDTTFRGSFTYSFTKMTSAFHNYFFIHFLDFQAHCTMYKIWYHFFFSFLRLLHCSLILNVLFFISTWPGLFILKHAFLSKLLIFLFCLQNKHGFYKYICSPNVSQCLPIIASNDVSFILFYFFLLSLLG